VKKNDNHEKDRQDDGFIKNYPALSGIPPLAGDFLRDHQNYPKNSVIVNKKMKVPGFRNARQCGFPLSTKRVSTKRGGRPSTPTRPMERPSPRGSGKGALSSRPSYLPKWLIPLVFE
jgi:hypothetical protein